MGGPEPGSGGRHSQRGCRHGPRAGVQGGGSRPQPSPRSVQSRSAAPAWNGHTAARLCYTYVHTGGPQTGFVYKSCALILTCVSFGHPPRTPHVTPCAQRDASPWLRAVFECVDVDAFPCSCCWCVTLPTSTNIPLGELFSSGVTNKLARGQDQRNREGGAQDHAVLGQKLLNMQRSVGRCAPQSPIMKWANALRLQKNSLKPNAASHNNASWCTDTDGSPEHSPSGGSLFYKGPALQKTILFFLRGPWLSGGNGSEGQ